MIELTRHVADVSEQVVALITRGDMTLDRFWRQLAVTNPNLARIYRSWYDQLIASTVDLHYDVPECAAPSFEFAARVTVALTSLAVGLNTFLGFDDAALDDEVGRRWDARGDAAQRRQAMFYAVRDVGEWQPDLLVALTNVANQAVEDDDNPLPWLIRARQSACAAEAMLCVVLAARRLQEDPT